MKYNLIGKKFGRLTVVGLADKKKYKERWWKCKCVCGNYIITRTSYLTSKHTKSCGCLIREDLTGKKFNKLTVIKRLGSIKKHNKKQILWLCQCDCGKYRKTTSAKLTTGTVKSCGCLVIESIRKICGPKLSIEEAGINRIIKNYKRGAKDRNLKWALKKEDVSKLCQDFCYYCGDIPRNIMKLGLVNTRAFKYNGIDRINNQEGYTKENCVSCCKLCNRAKSSMSEEEFLEWFSRIILHNNKKLDNFQEFYLKRVKDPSGISGVGIVAHGIITKSKQCIIEWYSPLNSFEICDNIETVEKIHGHDGSTKIILGSPIKKEISE